MTLTGSGMSIKDAFEQHAIPEEEIENSPWDPVKPVTVRLKSSVLAQVDALAKVCNLPRQSVLDELIEGGMEQAKLGYLNAVSNEENRPQKIEELQELIDSIFTALAGDQKGGEK